MNDTMLEKQNKLEDVLGYSFKDHRLLDEALTHRSFINESDDKSISDNQRLEFFGDAVIDFILSGLLLELFPDCREGELTKIRATLVDEKSLARLASELGLGAFLKMGRGEERSGGRVKRSLLADAYEALVAAVYLDGGLDSVQRFLVDQFRPLLVNRRNVMAGRDYKTDLQELAQAARSIMPRYVLTDIAGPDHEQYFTVEVFLGNELFGKGSGQSKKEAEQSAARSGLERLRESSSSTRT